MDDSVKKFYGKRNLLDTDALSAIAEVDDFHDAIWVEATHDRGRLAVEIAHPYFHAQECYCWNGLCAATLSLQLAQGNSEAIVVGLCEAGERDIIWLRSNETRSKLSVCIHGIYDAELAIDPKRHSLTGRTVARFSR